MFESFVPDLCCPLHQIQPNLLIYAEDKCSLLCPQCYFSKLIYQQSTLKKTKMEKKQILLCQESVAYFYEWTEGLIELLIHYLENPDSLFNVTNFKDIYETVDCFQGFQLHQLNRIMDKVLEQQLIIFRNNKQYVEKQKAQDLRHELFLNDLHKMIKQQPRSFLNIILQKYKKLLQSFCYIIGYQLPQDCLNNLCLKNSFLDPLIQWKQNLLTRYSQYFLVGHKNFLPKDAGNKENIFEGKVVQKKQLIIDSFNAEQNDNIYVQNKELNINWFKSPRNFQAKKEDSFSTSSPEAEAKYKSKDRLSTAHSKKQTADSETFDMRGDDQNKKRGRDKDCKINIQVDMIQSQQHIQENQTLTPISEFKRRLNQENSTLKKFKQEMKTEAEKLNELVSSISESRYEINNPENKKLKQIIQYLQIQLKSEEDQKKKYIEELKEKQLKFQQQVERFNNQKQQYLQHYSQLENYLKDQLVAKEEIDIVKDDNKRLKEILQQKEYELSRINGEYSHVFDVNLLENLVLQFQNEITKVSEYVNRKLEFILFSIEQKENQLLTLENKVTELKHFIQDTFRSYNSMMRQTTHAQKEDYEHKIQLLNDHIRQIERENQHLHDQLLQIKYQSQQNKRKIIELSKQSEEKSYQSLNKINELQKQLNYQVLKSRQSEEKLQQVLSYKKQRQLQIQQLSLQMLQAKKNNEQLLCENNNIKIEFEKIVEKKVQIEEKINQLENVIVDLERHNQEEFEQLNDKYSLKIEQLERKILQYADKESKLHFYVENEPKVSLKLQLPREHEQIQKLKQSIRLLNIKIKEQEQQIRDQSQLEENLIEQIINKQSDIVLRNNEITRMLVFFNDMINRLEEGLKKQMQEGLRKIVRSVQC